MISLPYTASLSVFPYEVLLIIFALPQMIPPSTFVKLIRTFRGLTQKELGDLAGIHEVAIRKYELGKNLPKPEQLRKIADALNVMSIHLQNLIFRQTEIYYLSCLLSTKHFLPLLKM